MDEGAVIRLKDNDPKSHTYGKEYIFDLQEIKSPVIQTLYKKYLIENYRQGVKVNTLRTKKTSMHQVFRYLNERKVELLNSVDADMVNGLAVFLKTVPSEQSGKKLTIKSQYSAMSAFKKFVEWVQIHDPKMAPESDIFADIAYKRVNRKKITYFSENVLKQIDTALKIEKNPYLKAFVSIMRHTGLRISDILLLKVDCVREAMFTGYELRYFNHKKRDEGISIAIPSDCCHAIQELVKSTESLRNNAPDSCKDLLFIHQIERTVPSAKKGEIRVLSDKGIEAWVDKFAEAHNIRDENGDLVRIRAHMMRRSLGTHMVADGMSLFAVKSVLDHESIKTTTTYYIGEVDKKRADVTKKLGVIGNIEDIPDSVFENADEKAWFFKHKETSACLSDGYCTKEIIRDGELCERLVARDKCYRCPKFITTPEYLDALIARRDRLTQQIENGIAVGGVHYADHFTKTIEALSEIISALTEIKRNGGERNAT